MLYNYYAYYSLEKNIQQRNLFYIFSSCDSFLFNLIRKLWYNVSIFFYPKYMKHSNYSRTDTLSWYTRSIIGYDTNVSRHLADLYENLKDILWPHRCQEFGENRTSAGLPEYFARWNVVRPRIIYARYLHYFSRSFISRIQSH